MLEPMGELGFGLHFPCVFKQDLEPWGILGGPWFPGERAEAVNKRVPYTSFLLSLLFLVCA